MAQAGQAVSDAKNKVERSAKKAASSPLVDRLMRFGYVVRGLLYAEVGLLAVGLALGRGGQTTDKEGAIALIGAQPFGKLLLLLIAVGLAGYALWGFVRAILDPLNAGTDAKGLAERGGYLLSGISYATLLAPTIQLLTGAGAPQSGGGSGPLEFSAGLMQQSYGPWLIGAAGVIIMVGALGEFYRAISANFKKNFNQGCMSEQEKHLALWFGRFGHAARGVVFGMIGFFVFRAAQLRQQNQARGLDGVLAILASQNYGPILLGIVALGLISFGIFSILCARWMRVTNI